MIVAIEGIITKKEPTFCVLKTVTGVSYGISISLGCSAQINKGEKIELLTAQILREDADLLYGFLDEKEKRMFEMLIKLNGIGANTSMAVCSSLNSDNFLRAIINGDTATLTTVPGIGPKTARRIIAELSDAKIELANDGEQYKIETISALENLGFKRDKINKILLNCKSTNTADLIKEALKKLA